MNNLLWVRIIYYGMGLGSNIPMTDYVDLIGLPRLYVGSGSAVRVMAW